jgi:hypothetical protein
LSPDTAAAIDIARELAWLPVCNATDRSSWYHRRKELHEELGIRIAKVRLSANASPQLRALITAIKRVAAASFSNRMGHPYYERKTAVLQLRGCFDSWDKSR